ncbi:MAG TPA: hypothetical protein VHU62_05150 [Mycobacterium sp.]|nr:hypothetical protein [Mycobacterium sp.]
MTDLAATFGPKQDTGAGTSPAPSPEPSPEPSTAAPSPAHPIPAPTTLITEQEVRFSTAAAVALPPARTRGFGDVVHALAEKVRVVFASSEKAPAKRHYPKRYDFIEDARMAREMDRL